MTTVYGKRVIDDGFRAIVKKVRFDEFETFKCVPKCYDSGNTGP